MKRLLFALAVWAVVAAAPPARAATVTVQLGTNNDVIFPDTPQFVMVPGTRVYYLQNDSGDYDVYRYGNTYYVTDNGTWYRSASFRGPYVVARSRAVPRRIITATSYQSRNGNTRVYTKTKVKVKHHHRSGY